MKITFWFLALIVINLLNVGGVIYSSAFIHADNPNIQYFGRWDMTDKLHPKHSWPGVYIYAEFTGTSIGVRLADNINYYNVYIDGNIYKVFHGDKESEADYILADSLENTRHTFRFSKRNICFDQIFSFDGLILDDGAELLQPQPKSNRKIEFIGDSYTAAESNEAKEQELPWEARFPVTNIDKGFAPLIANHFHAQYNTTCRSGIGIVCDWQGDTAVTLPKIFDRTLMEAPEPKWDFSKWIPDLVVVCLGLNDFSGLKDTSGNVSEDKSEFFRNGYHNFLQTIRQVYPKVEIVALAAYPDWIRDNVKQVVDEEIKSGRQDIYYAQFDYFDGGYVAYGHPTIETHKKMADQIIEQIESFNTFAE